MREEQLVVHPFEDLQILDYKSIQQINEHAYAELKGIIPFDKREAYVDAGRKQLWIQVLAVSEEKEEMLFYGVVSRLQIEVNNGICTVNISLYSGTLLMDFEEHTRSF